MGFPISANSPKTSQSSHRQSKPMRVSYRKIGEFGEELMTCVVLNDPGGPPHPRGKVVHIRSPQDTVTRDVTHARIKHLSKETSYSTHTPAWLQQQQPNQVYYLPAKPIGVGGPPWALLTQRTSLEHPQFPQCKHL